jgi:hypothetical protein
VRKIILHAGLGKTGSSTIQHLLSQHHELLKQSGIHYAVLDGGSTSTTPSSGNGARLAHSLATNNRALSAEILGHLAPPGSVALVSSELFGLLDTASWRLLAGCCGELSIQIERLVACVREPIGFLASSYGQEVKRHGEWRQLDKWLAKRGWQHYDALRVLREVFNNRLLRVISYDGGESEFLPAFFSATFPSNPALAKLGQFWRGNPRVNRSHSPLELHYLKLLNERLGKSFASQLSDHFLQNELSFALLDYLKGLLRGSVSKCLATDPFKEQRDELDSQIRCVNRLFATSFKTFDISACENSPAEATASRKAELEEHNTLTHSTFSSFMCSSLSRARLDAFTEYSQHLIAQWSNTAAGQKVKTTGKLNSFDYSILNPDVPCSGFDPETHYELYGKEEKRPTDIGSYLRDRPLDSAHAPWPGPSATP